MYRPYIAKEYRTEEHERDFLNAQINGEQEFLMGCLLNNGTVVFRLVDIDGFQIEHQTNIPIEDIMAYRDEIHPGLAVFRPTSEPSINPVYLVQPTIRIAPQMLFIRGEAVIYRDEWPQNPRKYHSFSLATSKEVVTPDKYITGSLNFFLGNEDVIKEQRYQFGNDIRFAQLEGMYETSRESIPSPQDIQRHQLVMNG